MDKEKMKTIRAYLDMSQSQFAEYIGVSSSTISMIEAGHREVSDKLTSRIARKFEVTDDFIQFLKNRKRLGSD